MNVEEAEERVSRQDIQDWYKGLLSTLEGKPGLYLCVIPMIIGSQESFSSDQNVILENCCIPAGSVMYHTAEALS